MSVRDRIKTWETDDEHLASPANISLPTPENTPYRTPSRTSQNSVSPSGRRPRSPPPVPERAEKRASRDYAIEDKISPLDPRRFTPTLHANLVSEILALRRDQDEKVKLIDSLEENLNSTQEEHDTLKKEHAVTAKESRSLKRQLALLEGGTTSALGELARERDEAVDSVAETKQRLEETLKKLRTQQNDSDRVHDQWAQERDAWDDEKRRYERKIHVTESRLKAVLDEVMAFQAAHPQGQDRRPGSRDSDGGESLKDNDAGSIRSIGRSNSLRFSTFSGPGAIQLNGQTLADELDFDDEDEDDMDDQESVYSKRTGPRHTRNFSRESGSIKFHNRNRSMDSLRGRGSTTNRKLFMNRSVMEALEGEKDVTAIKVDYTDTGVQFSPPPSPKLQPIQTIIEPMKSPLTTPDRDSLQRTDSEFEANQGRKRVQLTTPTLVEPQPTKSMVSASSQTIEEPLSPPRSPELKPLEEEQAPVVKLPYMVTAETQTEELYPLRRSTPTPPLLVPSINIQPPTSRPTTHMNLDYRSILSISAAKSIFSLLGRPRTRRCRQKPLKLTNDFAMLPRHLQPSAITSRPNSPLESVKKRLSSAPSDLETSDMYPGNNDDGPLSDHKGAPARRPHRFSSLFAGFDTASSGEEDFAEAENSDGEYRTALTAPRGKRPNTTAQTSPEDNVIAKRLARSSVKTTGTEVYSSFNLVDKESTGSKRDSFGKHFERSPAAPSGPGDRASVMRKAAMIQSGIATHQGRGRSPSLPDGQDPPFPIPTRASSRQPSSRVGMSGRRSPTKGLRGHRDSYRTHSVRKVRSAAALPPLGRYHRPESRSPPMSPSTGRPESPGLPPLPRNDLTTPRGRERGSSNYRRHKHELSTNTDKTHTTDVASVSSTTQMTGVVDAIAQTMVGEWMFKYVRRRKSFGVPDNSNTGDNGNDRHKRWVWLAPYERAILWSSKQPSSGSALMGKTGRKLSIQSVLDVKDDNPAPKGVGTIFNRSILILTPQRALKFTAPTADRHYIWLTALSFLAHSQQAVPELPNASSTLRPPKGQHPLPEIEAPPPATKAKRAGIRDSIRLAKGRPTNSKQEAANIPTVPHLPSAASSQVGDGSSFHVPDTFGIPSTNHVREDSRDAAEPPFIPRFDNRGASSGAHGRKRSNTGGHIPPPLSFRGFGGFGGSGHNPSNSTAGASEASSEMFASVASVSNGTWGMSQTTSRRTSEASSPPANFFDAIGTMRMEAFISPLGPVQFKGQDGHDESRHVTRRRSKEFRRRNSRTRRSSRDSYGYRRSHGGDAYSMSAKTPSEADYAREDPFKNF